MVHISVINILFSLPGRECAKIYEALTLEQSGIALKSTPWEAAVDDSNENSKDAGNEPNSFSSNKYQSHEISSAQSSDLGYASVGQHSDSSFVSSLSSERNSGYSKANVPNVNREGYSGYAHAYPGYNNQFPDYHNVNCDSRLGWPPQPMPSPSNAPLPPPNWRGHQWQDTAAASSDPPLPQLHQPASTITKNQSPAWKNPSHSDAGKLSADDGISRESLDSRIQLLLKIQGGKKLELAGLGIPKLDIDGKLVFTADLVV